MDAAEDDDIPATPRITTPSRDTERDLVMPERDSLSRATDPDERRTTLGENTLLSLKAGALGEAHHEAERSDAHVEELDRRFTQLEARLRVLELQRAAGLGTDRRWMIWVGLLIALALGWQLRALVR